MSESNKYASDSELEAWALETERNLLSQSVASIKSMMRKKGGLISGLRLGGRKAELVKRLVDHMVRERLAAMRSVKGERLAMDDEKVLREKQQMNDHLFRRNKEERRTAKKATNTAIALSCGKTVASGATTHLTPNAVSSNNGCSTSNGDSSTAITKATTSVTTTAAAPAPARGWWRAINLPVLFAILTAVFAIAAVLNMPPTLEQEEGGDYASSGGGGIGTIETMMNHDNNNHQPKIISSSSSCDVALASLHVRIVAAASRYQRGRGGPAVVSLVGPSASARLEDILTRLTHCFPAEARMTFNASESSSVNELKSSVMAQLNREPASLIVLRQLDALPAALNAFHHCLDSTSGALHLAGSSNAHVDCRRAFFVIILDLNDHPKQDDQKSVVLKDTTTTTTATTATTTTTTTTTTNVYRGDVSNNDNSRVGDPVTTERSATSVRLSPCVRDAEGPECRAILDEAVAKFIRIGAPRMGADPRAMQRRLGTPVPVF